MDPAFAPA